MLCPRSTIALGWEARSGDRVNLQSLHVVLTPQSFATLQFARDVAPKLSARPDLWPAPHNTLAEFLRVAGLVQSRAFHMVRALSPPPVLLLLAFLTAVACGL